MSDGEARADFLDQVKAAIDADRQNARKWHRLYDWFDRNLGIKGGLPGGVAAKLLTEDKQLTNRIRKAFRCRQTTSQGSKRHTTW